MNPPPWRHPASFYPGRTGPHLFLFFGQSSEPLIDPISLQPARFHNCASRRGWTTPCKRALIPPRRSFHYLNYQRGSSLAPTKARPPLYGSPRGSKKKKARNVRILPSGERSGEEPSEGEGAERKEFSRVADERGGCLLQRLERLTFLPGFLLIPKVAKLLFATRQAGRYTNFSSNAFYRKGTDSAPVKVKGWGRSMCLNYQ